LPCDPALLLAGRFGVAAAVVDPVVEALDAVVVGGAEVLMARETAEVHGGAVVGCFHGAAVLQSAPAAVVVAVVEAAAQTRYYRCCWCQAS
jgi:hypothetical protein